MSAGLSAAFLVNFMFWTGLAAGATAFAALLDLTGAGWAAALRSDARRFRYFLPLAVPLYLLMLLGARRLYPWISQPIGSSWLRFGPFVARDLGALTALASAGAWFWSRAQERTARAAWFLVAYAVGFSVLAIDLLMSLAAPWGSTLFPAYFFVANAYAAIAAVGLVTLRRARGGLSEASRSDLQKLLLGFSLLWMYLVWSQFIVIWYGNLRSEVGYLKAVLYERWRPLAWIIWASRFGLPLVILLPRRGSRRIQILVAGALIVAGFWGECFLLVAPVVSSLPDVPAAMAVTAAFCAGFVLIARFASPPSSA